VDKNLLTGKWHFRTIGMGTVNYRAAAKRLSKEVLSTGLFETSIGCDERWLKRQSPKFWDDHKKVLKARVPGFGWWIWKPEFIRISLSQIPLDEGLLYLDAGSFVSPDSNDLESLIKYLNIAMKEGVVGSNSQDFPEESYTSAEILDEFNLSSLDRKSNQFYGGFLLLRNSAKAKGLIDEWSNLLCLDNHRYLLPKPSQNDHKTFVHHAYDQAILSCMLKKISAKSIKIGDRGSVGCIRVVRHKFGFRYLNPRLIEKSLYGAIGFSSRIKLAIERRLMKHSLAIQLMNHRD